MNEFYEGENQTLEGSLKRASLRLSCPKEGFLTRKRVLYTYVRFLPKQAYILTLFWEAIARGGKISRQSKR